MGFKKKLKKKLKGIIKSYEDGSKLGDYAQGRLANTKMILDIVKEIDYTPYCKSDSEQLCDKNKSPYEFDSNTYIGRKVGKINSDLLFCSDCNIDLKKANGFCPIYIDCKELKTK